jgi:hypothetical protein
MSELASESVSTVLTRARFTRMQDGTAEEFALIGAAEAASARELPGRVLDAVRALDDGGASGYAVTRLEHSLQSATRAERDGRRAGYVVAALVHDIGDGLARTRTAATRRRCCGRSFPRSCAGSWPTTRCSRCTTTAPTS